MRYSAGGRHPRAMTTMIAPPLDPSIAEQLSAVELEQELTLASLTTAREQHYEVLPSERRRRRHDSGKLESHPA